ncbi:GerMN domain-containing protein [Paenibacillus sp. CMAA1364]
MSRKWWSTGLLALVVVLGTGCGDKPTAQPNETQPEIEIPTTNTSGGGNTIEVEDKAPVDPSKKETIKVYFTDPEALEVVENKTEISFKNDSEKYEAAFKALQKNDDAKFISLWNGMELLSLKFKDGEVTIDINLPDEARLGSSGEMFAIEALQKTMFQFDEVKAIELLVNGEQIESLMGHVDLEHPMMKK